MRKISNLILNIILAVGLLSLVGGFLIFIYAVESDLKFIYQIWPLLTLLAGVITVYFAIAFSHRTYMLFIGVEVSFASCYALVLERGLISLSFATGWPLFVILTGIALIFSCLYKYKKLRPNYFAPAIVMVALGALFMLFSLRVIKIPILRFFSIAGPVLMILAGTASIVFFFIQMGHRDLVIKEEQSDNEEEGGVFFVTDVD